MKRILAAIGTAIIAAAIAYAIDRYRYPAYESYDDLLAELEREGEALAPDPYLVQRFPHLYGGTWTAATPCDAKVTWKKK